MATNDTTANIMKEIERLGKNRDKLLVKLTASLEIQRVWPEAFIHGNLTSHIKGNLDKPETLEIRIQNLACQKTFPITDFGWDFLAPHFQFLMAESDWISTKRFHKILKYHQENSHG